MEGGEEGTAEAHVHTLLVAHGVLVPHVLRYDSFTPEVGRSPMLTGEMPGQSLTGCGDERVGARVAEHQEALAAFE